jgi:hypothetical protein
VVVHTDHDEGRPRRDRRQCRQPTQALIAQHQLVHDDHGGRQPGEQPDHVGEISGRAERLDSGLALEQLPERGSHAVMAGGDEDRDRGRFVRGCVLRDHPDKHRPPAPGHHRG